MTTGIDRSHPAYQGGVALARVHIDWWNANVEYRLRENRSHLRDVEAGRAHADTAGRHWLAGFVDTLTDYLHERTRTA